MAIHASDRRYLKSGASLKQSLRDGRVVFCQGELIDDVTTHAATAGGIEQVAAIYDEQASGRHDELLTCRREDGQRVSSAFMLPRSREDLARRREGIRYVASKTWGTHCRGPDMIASFTVGMLGHLPSFRRACPEYAENIAAYHAYAEQNHLYLSEAIVDPQGWRVRSGRTTSPAEDPQRAVLRITRESEAGIWVSGLKGVGTVAPQSNEIFIGSLQPPLAAEAFWAWVPANAHGLRMYCREAVSRPGSSLWRHPLAAQGEEAEAMIVLDDVFIPRWRIMAARVPALAEAGFFNQWTAYSHWYTLVRLETKAELYAALARRVVEVLGLEAVPVIRQRLGEIVQFAEILRGMSLAAIDTAGVGESGLMLPAASLLAAGRIYAIEHLPRMLHLLRELCGQGLILRFDAADLQAEAAFGHSLGWFLDSREAPAVEKNLLMHLVWDVAASEHAMRALIFEAQHALSEPLLRERLALDYDYAPGLAKLRATLDPLASPTGGVA